MKKLNAFLNFLIFVTFLSGVHELHPLFISILTLPESILAQSKKNIGDLEFLAVTKNLISDDAKLRHFIHENRYEIARKLCSAHSQENTSINLSCNYVPVFEIVQVGIEIAPYVAPYIVKALEMTGWGLVTYFVFKTDSKESKRITERADAVYDNNANIIYRVDDLSDKDKLNIIGNEEFLATGGGGGRGPEDPDQFNQRKKKKDFPPDDIDKEKFRKAVEYATTKNSLNHFFGKKKHGFDDLLNKMGGKDDINVQKKLVEEVLELMRYKKFPVAGEFPEVIVDVAGYKISVTGIIHENIIRIGTMFIRS